MYNKILKRINMPFQTAVKAEFLIPAIITFVMTITAAYSFIGSIAHSPITNVFAAMSSGEIPKECGEIPKDNPIEGTIPKSEDSAAGILEEWAPDPTETEAIAKVLYGECRGVSSKAERAAVAWCVLNRVDSSCYPDTIIEVLKQPRQFIGYSDNLPVLPSMEELAADVLTRWHAEKEGETDVGRVLPKNYIYFTGDGAHNYFTVEYLGNDYWDFSLPNPYES